MQEQKYDEAIEFFNKDIKENPKNGYSFIWIVTIRDYLQEYGQALTAADLALKYLPKKDVDYVAFALSTRAGVYLHLEDSVKALADYNEAVRLKPKETQPYEERAQLYYELEKYDLADADYRKMTELKPGDVMGYMGLGRNANMQERWEDAIKQFDYVTKLASEYSSGYSFRAESRNHGDGSTNPQNMLRMIGFGENLGSGFPKIIAAWKETNWGEPELKNKIELDEVELVLPISASKAVSETANATVNATVNSQRGRRM